MTNFDMECLLKAEGKLLAHSWAGVFTKEEAQRFLSDAAEYYPLEVLRCETLMQDEENKIFSEAIKAQRDRCEAYNINSPMFERKSLIKLANS